MKIAWSEAGNWLRKNGDILSWGNAVFFPKPPVSDNYWQWAITWFPPLLPNYHIVVIAQGAGGFAGSHPECRVALVGDVCLDEIIERTPSAGQLLGLPSILLTRNAQIGTILHELLHLSGYEHQQGGIMAEPWKYPNITLTALTSSKK